VKGYSGKGDTTLQDTPPLRSAGRIGSGAARGYHLVAVPPLDLGAMVTADWSCSVEMQKSDHAIVADLSPSLPLRERPYLGRAHRLGHDDGVVPHVRGIGHSARLRQLRAFRFPTTRALTQP
jgi:hypothetical protein